MKHLLNNNKKHTTVKGNNMAMKPKKRTSPKNSTYHSTNSWGLLLGLLEEQQGRGAAKKVGKNIVKRKATGIRDAKGLRKMEKALSGSKGPKRTTPASKPTSQLERKHW
jgi:hypothetical protein